MAKGRRNTDELTTKMHSEFTVPDKTDRKHIVYTALHMIDKKLMTVAQAIATYGITQADVDKHQEEWDNL
jgi:hypothetical protein